MRQEDEEEGGVERMEEEGGMKRMKRMAFL